MKLVLLFAGLLLAAYTVGCVSIGAHVQNVGLSKSNIYAGTKTDFAVIRIATGRERTGTSEIEWARTLAPIAVIDLPFSLVMDTVLFPIDGIRQGVIAIKNTNTKTNSVVQADPAYPPQVASTQNADVR